MQPVLWSKGVLLGPQQLQTQDRFLQDLIQFQLSALTFYPWGFSRLAIDRESLSGGTFAISSAAGIFPDGLLFDMPQSDPSPLPRALGGCWDQDQRHLDLYLAIPEYRDSGTNVSTAGRDLHTRYRAEELLRRDENTGLSEKPIQVARKNFRILVAGEALEGSTALRVARVQLSATGEYRLDPQFIPPLIDIGASDYLLSIARRLVEILSAKSSVLSGTRRQRNQSLVDFSITDVANFWLLYTVNTYFPQLRHLFEVRRGHPGELFSAMLSLAGALTTFAPATPPQLLPGYQHDDLATCFTTLDEKLRDLLETVVPASCVSLPMRLVQPSVYATALDQDRYLAAPQLFLAISADAKLPDLVQKVPQLVKLTAADQIDRLIRQALPGVSMTYVAEPPAAIPVKSTFHYFLLRKSGVEWDAIVGARNLAAYVPGDFRDPQLELVLVLPPGKS
jgi:type VI secretion system protein ImpJ